jgi:exodeoxyribonuclease V alpha subunit
LTKTDCITASGAGQPSPPDPGDSAASTAEERFRELRHHGLTERAAYRQVIAERFELQAWQLDAARIAGKSGLSCLASLRVAMAAGPHETVRLDRKGNEIRVLFNPWNMLTRVPRLTLDHADRMAEQLNLAEKLGLPYATPDRDEAAFLKALESVLKEPWNSGSTHADFGKVAAKLVNVVRKRRDISDALASLKNDKALYSVYLKLPGRDGKLRLQHRVASASLYRAELSVARRAKTGGTQFIVPEPPGGLDAEQRAAFTAAFTNPLSIITAKPGHGKTRAVAAIVDGAARERVPVIAATFMGRAAVRIREELSKLGIPSSVLYRGPGTLHSVFRINPGSNNSAPSRKKEEEEHPGSGILIIDEASMVPVALMSQVLAKLPDDWNIVLAGDAGQLPAIDPGNLLADLTRSGTVPVTELVTNYRAEYSDLAEAVQSVSMGRVPPNTEHFKTVPVPRETVTRIIGDAVTSTANRAGCDPRDVFVITAQNACSKNEVPILTGDLNRALKAALNPAAKGDWETITAGDRVYADGGNAAHRIPAGDGEYIQRAYTGELGTVVHVSSDVVTVAWDGREDNPRDYYPDEVYERDPLLRLAYAVTVHKVQGGERPAVIYVADSLNSPMLLTRTLVYTAISRARNLAVVIDVDGGFSKALRNEGYPRQTLLPCMLRGELQ